MYNFEYKNPVKIIFGKGSISKVAEVIPACKNILITYGGGSIKKNGIYQQIKKYLDSGWLQTFDWMYTSTLVWLKDKKAVILW